jgi:hypothetical protein
MSIIISEKKKKKKWRITGKQSKAKQSNPTWYIGQYSHNIFYKKKKKKKKIFSSSKFNSYRCKNLLI